MPLLKTAQTDAPIYMYSLEIADLKVKMNYFHSRLLKQAKAYIKEFKGKEDIFINIDEECIKQFQRENSHLTIDECEYILTSIVYYENLLLFNGFMLHSSAVEYENQAYLFSAPSGTGKSTHTQLWLKHFGEKARIINDDKPAVRLINDKFYVYGTPWSGKTDLNINTKVPLKAIIFIERAENNYTYKMNNEEAVKMLLYQSYSSNNMQLKMNFLDLMDKLIRNNSVYKLGCNMSEDAVKTIYEAVNKGGC